MIDQGGAGWRNSFRAEEQAKRLVDKVTDALVPKPAVRFSVTETHDGEACDCIDKEMVLHVGQEIELTHVCHDGRVDKVVAKITAIEIPGPEHGKADSR